MKPNSIDMRIELLAAARGALEAFKPVMADLNSGSAATDEWHAATKPYRRLKDAVAQYDQPV